MAAASRRERGHVTVLNLLMEAPGVRVHLYRRRPAPRSVPQCMETGPPGPPGPPAVPTVVENKPGIGPAMNLPQPMEVFPVLERMSKLESAGSVLVSQYR